MTTTDFNLPTWCLLRAERFRDFEQHEMAMYPDADSRDMALIEHVIRVLGNAELGESREVLAILAGQHQLELNAAGSVEWLKGRVAELTAELAKARKDRDEYAEDNTRVAVALVDVQRKLAGVEADNQSLRKGHDAYVAENARLQAEMEQTRAALTASRENAANLANENGRLVAENARLTNELEHRRAEVEELRATLQGPVPADGPWNAFIVHEGWAVDDLSDLAPDDEVDIVIVRDTALPDDEGHMAGTYKPDDVAFEVEDIYVDGDGGTDAATIYARAQVMAAGLNAAEATR